MANSPHYFIGIPINKQVKQEIAGWQSRVREHLATNYRVWTHPEDFHITLKFLGEVSRSQLPLLEQEVKKGLFPQPFSIGVRGIGTFGKPRKPRVLWAGIETTPELEKLQEKLEEVCRQIGFPANKQPYRPHITIAKKWKGEKLEKQLLDQLDAEFSTVKAMEVHSFSLYRIYPSKLPKYEEIKKFEL